MQFTVETSSGSARTGVLKMDRGMIHTPAFARETKILQTRPGSAGFFVSRITYTLDDRPVTMYRIVYRGDEYRFTAEF